MITDCAEASEIRGVFSLILFSGPWPGAVANVAFLDREDDRITLEPFAPAFSFRVVKSLTAEEAIAQAEAFVSLHSSFNRSRITRISDDYGRIIGYEIRPLYMQTTFGLEDILDISYRQRDNHIDIYVRIDPDVERKL